MRHDYEIFYGHLITELALDIAVDVQLLFTDENILPPDSPLFRDIDGIVHAHTEDLLGMWMWARLENDESLLMAAIEPLVEEIEDVLLRGYIVDLCTLYNLVFEHCTSVGESLLAKDHRALFQLLRLMTIEDIEFIEDGCLVLELAERASDSVQLPYRIPGLPRRGETIPNRRRAGVAGGARA